MFQTYTHIQRRRGRDGSSRLEYLQGLVNDYEEASQLGECLEACISSTMSPTLISPFRSISDVRRKILANLSNFAYDPINYEWLYQVGAAQLFIGTRLNMDVLSAWMCGPKLCFGHRCGLERWKWPSVTKNWDVWLMQLCIRYFSFCLTDSWEYV